MRSLRAQMSLSMLLVVFVAVALISLTANIFINRRFEAYVAARATGRSEQIAAELGGQYDARTGEWNADFIHSIGMYSLYDGYIVKVYGMGGGVLWDAENHDMSLCGQVMDEISARMEEIRPAGGFAEHIYPLEQGGQRIGSASVSYYGPFFFSESDFKFINALNGAVLSIGALACLLSVAAGAFLSARVSLPITRSAEIARRISRGDYNIEFGRKSGTKELNDLVSAIERLAASLNEQENLRKRLTADVAHELRTPLTAVSSHLEAMMDGLWDVTPERLRSCHEEIARLGGLVANLERLAKIEGENLNLDMSPTDLMELVSAACSVMEAEANKKSISLVISGESSVAPVDGGRIRQVIVNLLSNAVKYTPPNGNVRVEVKDTPQNGVITVSDDGIGIPEGECQLIFERFYRADKSRDRKTGGAGVGLAIAKAIITAHKGTITAASRIGEGSCFTVMLPKHSDTRDRAYPNV
ncbi:sensor histidine kinase [Synergistales bacterium]|nr:sensor histidine kinase [Synergistales bacterium]